MAFQRRWGMLLAGLPAILIGLWANPLVSAQHDALKEVEDALMKRDRGAAARALASLADSEDAGDLGRRALLEVSCRPIKDRIEGYLAVADGFRDGDVALVAVLAALDLISPLDDSFGLFPDESRPEIADTKRFLTRIGAVLDGLAGKSAADPRYDEARRIHAAATKHQYTDRAFIGGTMRIGSSTSIPLPCPLTEAARFQLFPIDGVNLAVTDFLNTREKRIALVERLVPADAVRAELPNPGPGIYVLMSRGESTGELAARMVLIGDLALTVVGSHDGVVCLATLAQKPFRDLPLVLERMTEKGIATSTSAVTGIDGTAVIKFGASEPGRSLRLRATAIDASGATHPAFVDWTTAAPEMQRARVTMHAETDRPLYRAGETVRGRVLLRRHDPTAIDSFFGKNGAKPTSSPLANRAIEIYGEYPGASPTPIRATTDDFGVAPFEFQLEPGSPTGHISLRVEISAEVDEFKADQRSINGRHASVRIDSRTLARIYQFKRPPLLLDCDAPTEWDRRTADPVVTVRGTLASGVPAEGIDGKATIYFAGSFEHVPFRLDGRGEAKIRLALSEWKLDPGESYVMTKIEVTAPDGQVLRESLASMRIPAVEVETIETANRDDGPSELLSLALENSEITAGEKAVVNLRGPAHRAVIVYVGRETILAARAVVLDERGRAKVEIPTSTDWMPRVEITARAAESESSVHVYRRSDRGWTSGKLELRDPGEPLSISIEKDQSDYAPGATAKWRLQVTDRDQNPVRAGILLSVVDERIFELGLTRNIVPDDDLAPDWIVRNDFNLSSLLSGDPRALAGEFFIRGESRGGRGFGFGGGAPGGASRINQQKGNLEGTEKVLPPVRKNMRTTAFFAPHLLTDANGRLEVSFEFPDDLTKWRVTAVAIDAGRRLTRKTEHVSTRKPVAVEVDLPRFFRAGDESKIVGRVVSREAEAKDVGVILSADGGARVSPPGVEVTTKPDGAVPFNFDLKVNDPGSTAVTTIVGQKPGGDRLDAQQITVPVLSRSSVQPIVLTKKIDGETAFIPEIPEGFSVGKATVEILPSLDALLDQSIEYLTSYPYGCAEQTTSKLYPIAYAAMVRRSAANGDLPLGKALTASEGHRLEVGMARLRELQRPDGGFAWWSRGDDTDWSMTATVFRGLAYLSEAGIDPRRFGIEIGEKMRIVDEVALALESGWKLSDADDPKEEKAVRFEAAADLLTSLLLLDRTNERAQRACIAIVAQNGRFPNGLLARAGFALAKAGRPVEAKTALDLLWLRFENAVAIPRALSSTVDECEPVVIASMLRLLSAIDPKHGRKGELVGALLRWNSGGRYLHTSGTANVIAALAAVRSHEPRDKEVSPLSIEVRIGDQVALSEKNVDRTRTLVVPGAFGSRRADVKISGKESIYATVRFELTEDGAFAKAIAKPLVVARVLHRIERAADGSMQKTVVKDSVHRGEKLEALLTLRAPEGAERLVLDLPLFTGAEVGRDDQRLQISDDHVAVGIKTMPEDREFSIRVPLIAGVEGKFVWPSAYAESMYEPERWGRSDGQTIEVVAPKPIDASAVIAAIGQPFLSRIVADLDKRLRENIEPRDTVTTIESIGRVPSKSHRDRLVGELLERLGRRLGDLDVARAWGSAIGSDRVRYLSQEGWREFMTATNLDESDGIKSIVAAIATMDGDELERRVAATGDTASRRIYPLVLIHKAMPPTPESGQSRIAALRRLLFDVADLPNAGLRAERYEYIVRMFGDPSWRSRSMMVDPIREALDSVFRRGDETYGMIGDEDAAARVFADVSGFACDFIELWSTADLADQIAMTGRVSELNDAFAWPSYGGRPSQEFLKARAAFDRALAGVAPTAAKRFAAAVSNRSWGRHDSAIERWWSLAVLGADDATFSARAYEAMTALLSISPSDESGPIDDAVRVIERSLEGRTIDERLTSLLVATVMSGREDQRYFAFAALSPEMRPKIPDAVLANVALTEKADWAIEALLDRSPESARRCLRMASRLDNDALAILAEREFSASAFDGIPLIDVVALARGINASTEDGYQRRESLARTLATGRFSNDEIAAALAENRDPTERMVLVMACAKRGIRDVKWSPDDPARERYESILAARLGYPPAQDAVQRMFERSIFEHGQESVRKYEIDLLWAIATSGDVARLVEIGPEVPRTLAAEITASAKAESLAALLARPVEKGRDFSWIFPHLSADQADRLVPAAWDALLRGESTAAILGRARAELVRSTCPERSKIPTDSAKRLLNALDQDVAGHAEIARLFVDHADVDVRRRAATFIFESTGIATGYRDGEKDIIIAPTDESEAMVSVKRRIENGTDPRDLSQKDRDRFEVVRARLGILSR